FSRVGLTEKQALEAGYTIKKSVLPAQAIPKALVIGRPEGLLKAIIDEETGKILGAHLFCAESQEMINIIKMVMDANLPYT
ncbi:pyridine nucleotide-disulfide oxidoreductase, partial [Gemmiger formicilis]|nr:pyridine nucleotide-disulfide oxidoreductase [Gemmiger formicilis]